MGKFIKWSKTIKNHEWFQHISPSKTKHELLGSSSPSFVSLMTISSSWSIITSGCVKILEISSKLARHDIFSNLMIYMSARCWQTNLAVNELWGQAMSRQIKATKVVSTFFQFFFVETLVRQKPLDEKSDLLLSKRSKASRRSSSPGSPAAYEDRPGHHPCEAVDAMNVHDSCIHLWKSVCLCQFESFWIYIYIYDSIRIQDMCLRRRILKSPEMLSFNDFSNVLIDSEWAELRLARSSRLHRLQVQSDKVLTGQLTGLCKATGTNLIAALQKKTQQSFNQISPDFTRFNQI